MIENNLFNRYIIRSNINLIETIIICNKFIKNSIDTFGGCYLTISQFRKKMKTVIRLRTELYL